MSNIYLHYVLDEWFVKQVKSCLSGRAELVRYADDFVVLVKEESDAKRIMKVMPMRLAKYGLAMNQAKSQMVDFRRPPRGGKSKSTFNFLGFTHYWGKSRKGNSVVMRKTKSKSFSKGIKSIFEWIKQNRHEPVKEQHKSLIAKLKGHYNYFGITGNSQKLGDFKDKVQVIWYYWLNRRGNKRTLPWDCFKQFLHENPLPKVKIYHSYV